jgi:hypothetical protein
MAGLPTLIGTDNQIAWAHQIRERVGREFDRVANALLQVAARQVESDRENTHALLAILEEKRREVMANGRAGYFIHDWQELGDGVRRMLMTDPRSVAITAKRVARQFMARQRAAGI